MALSEKAELKIKIEKIKDERATVTLRNTELNRVIVRLKGIALIPDEEAEAKTEREAFIAQYEAEFAANTEKLMELQEELTQARKRIFELNGNRHVPYV